MQGFDNGRNKAMNYRVTDTPLEKEKNEIFEELLKYNLEHIECKEVRELAIFREDAKGGKVAGLIGRTRGNWLEIDYLWVSEALRRQDIGTEIIQKAEQVAKERGCKYVFLNTFGFQARGFYIKLGYEEVFVLENYPVTGKRHYFTKLL